MTDNSETPGRFLAIDSPSLQFLPRQQEVPGWLLKEDPLAYPAARLEAYLDTDAKHFLAHGVLDLTIGEYNRVGTEGFARVEVFRFPDFIKAFGAYSSRRKAVTNFLDLGNESFVGPHSIHVWRGSFYARLIGSGSADVMDAMKVLAAAVAERMPPAPGKPAVFNFLPEKFRVINSETLSAGPGLGQSFLANAFSASFEVEGDKIDGLILPTPAKDAAARVLDQYKNFFIRNGKLLDPVANLGEDNFTGEDRFAGRVVVYRLDRFVLAFRGFGDKQKLVDLAFLGEQRILGTIRKQLVSADKAKERGTEEDETSPPWEAPLPLKPPQ